MIGVDRRFRNSKVALAACCLLFLSSCGGQKPSPSPRPEPQIPDTKEETKTPEWNKNRTISLLVITNKDGENLGSSLSDYEAVCRKIVSLPREKVSAYMLTGVSPYSKDGREFSPNAVISDAVKCFPIFNPSSLKNGNLLLAKDWTLKFEGTSLSGSGCFLTTAGLKLMATGEKQLSYDVNLGLVTLKESGDQDALNKRLLTETKFPSSIFLLGSGSKSMISQIKEIKGYEKKMVNLSDNGDVALFIMAPKSYLLRSSEKLFDLQEGKVVGLRLQIEAAVDR